MRPSILVAGALCCLLCGVFCEAGQAQSLSRIAAPVNQFEQTPLTGNTPAQLLKTTDQGLVQPNLTIPRMMLMLRPSAQQQAALDQLLIEQQDRTSPNYHRWLSPEEYAARFGVAQADAQALTSWLQQQGFTQIQLSHTGRFISFSGTAGVAQNAFATELHHVLLDGRIHTTNVTSPLVPTAFADLIGAIIGLDDLPSRSFLKPAMTGSGLGGQGQGTSNNFTPTAFIGEYNLAPLLAAGITAAGVAAPSGINGSGVKIVVVGQVNPTIPLVVGQPATLLSDLRSFQTTFGILSSTPQTILGGSDPGMGLAPDAQEAALDLEWVSAIAPGATIVYDYAINAVSQAMVDAIDNTRGQIVSVSFGDCESSVSGTATSIQTIIKTGNAMGITVVAASGDQGAAACDVSVNAATHGYAVNFPASAPEATAVGGTEFMFGFNTTSSYVPEVVWNRTPPDQPLAASGGGVSILFNLPAWQSLPSIPVGGGKRYVPDVALNASSTIEPYTVISGGSLKYVGGTSAATPSMAAILALVQQYVAPATSQTPPGLGNVNPILYQLSQVSQTTIFHDIIGGPNNTSPGNNNVPCLSGSLDCPTSAPFTIGYSALKGYDEVTGLGSVDVSQLATSWATLPGAPALTATPSSVLFTSPAGSRTDPVTITLANNGRGLLTISSISLTGTNALSFTKTDTCIASSQLAPGASCTVSISFSPAIAGTQTAALSIVSDAAGSPTTIPLTGTATGFVPSGTLQTVHPFVGADGYGGGPIIQAADGNYYGVNAYGGSSAASNLCPGTGSVGGGCGTIFKIASGGYSVLYSFQGGPDGAYPSSIIQGPDGNLYVTALQGGSAAQCTGGCGTLLKVSTSGIPATVVYTFGTTPTDGQNPSTLTVGADGNLYGTTLAGGAHTAGTIFVLAPTSTTPNILFNFPGGLAGSYPETLVQGSNGLFYGMTQETTAPDYGVVFQIDTSGNYKTVYSFTDQADSANSERPVGGLPTTEIVITQPSHPQTNGLGVYATPKALVQYSDGNFYGTTASPGEVKRTVFQMTPSGVLNTLYNFTGDASHGDGGGSLYGLTLGSDGNFYGTSGDFIFRMTSGGRLSSLYPVTDSAGDSKPGFLLYAADGSFVDATTDFSAGTAPENACSSNCGYVFDYVPSPALSAPVQVSLSSTTSPLYTPVTLTWQALQAYSLTSQQCYAYLSGGPGGGSWTGRQSGTLVGSAYQGSAVITPTAAGIYTYALTCGGTLSGSAILSVTKLDPVITLTSSPSAVPVGASVALIATISSPLGTGPTPTGVVRFDNSSSNVGVGTLANGTVTATTKEQSQAFPPPITYIGFDASYEGDSNFNPIGATINVPNSSLLLSTIEMPGGFAGQAYSAALLATGGKTPYMWSLLSGSLPTGLSLNTTTGVISGTPTQNGQDPGFAVKVTDSLGATSSTPFELDIDIGSTLKIDPTPFGSGVANSPYQGFAYAYGGLPPYTFKITSGPLPPGLTLSILPGNNTVAVISGTPTISGTSTFNIQVTDSENIPMTASAPSGYSITITPASLLVTTRSLPGGVVSNGYGAMLAAAGGVAPYTWSVSSGIFPTGLSINSATGAISGSPTQLGTSTFTIQVKDSQGTPFIATASLSITVSAALTLTSSSIPSGVVGSTYTASLTAAGGAAPYMWRLTSGTLPPGISLTAGTGVLSGTPTQSGAFPVTVQVSDSETTPAVSSVALTFNVNATLAITSGVLPVATVGALYSVTPVASGGIPPYRWSIAGTLPAGLMLVSPSTGVISGMPVESGSSTFAVNVVDSEGTPVSVSKSFSISVGAAATPTGLRFIPITPCRVADTRNANGAFGGPILQGAASREFDIPLSACNIPSSAAAYSLNITVVPPGGLGFLTAYPSGQALPFASTLNSEDGRTKANAAIVVAGSNGGVSLYASSPTHAIIDINGYFVPASNPAALQFYPITPCRIADTRNATGPLGGPFIAGNTSRAFPVLSSTCQIPSTAQAYSLNVTAVPSGTLSYLTTWPTGQTQPLTSTLNAQPGNVTANAAIVAAGTNGEVSVYVTNPSDLVLDINGYFAPAGTGGLSLYPISTCRIIDTRTAAGAFAGTLPVNVETSSCALPSTAAAYVLSATVVPAVSLGFISLWPSGQAQPLVSTLNANDSAITSNMALVPVSNGVINVYASNSTNVILDISSYFGP